MSTAVGVIADSYNKPVSGGGGTPPVAGYVGWWDASDASSFTYSSGTVVSQWNDLSGSGKHFTQSTGSEQPNRNGTQNGKTTVVFSALNSMTMGSPVSTVVDNFTIFVASQRTGGDNNTSVVFHNGNPSANGYGVAPCANNFPNIGILRGGLAWTATATPRSDNPCVLTVRRAAGTWGMHQDSIATNLGITAAPITPAASTYMPSLFHRWAGSIYEVIFYNTALSSGDRLLVEDYLYAKWGMTLSSPTEIAGLVGWWDSSDAASITATGGLVDQWNDKSGTGRHLTATTTMRPTTGTRTQNSRNILDFNGTTNWMETTPITLPQPLTMFVVAASDNISGTRHLISVDGTNPAIYTFSSASWAYYAGSGQTVGAADTLAHVHAAIFNAATSQYQRDRNVLSINLSPGTAGYSSQKFRVCGNAANYWDGWVAEVILYNSSLSGTNLAKVQNYLRNKWGTP